MSKGGGKQTQTTTNEPWKAAQPYITDLLARGKSLSQQPAQYFPGSTVVGATGAEGAAWDARNAYNSNVFGGGHLDYGSAAGALNGAMGGNTPLASMAGMLAPQATQLLSGGFAAPNTSGISGIQIPGGSNAAANIGNYGFGTSLDASGRAPQFGVAGNLDARGAYQNMLSGQPDYAGTQGAIEAANAPLLRQFNEEILPGLNTRATFNNNQTGGIKGLNRVLPELGERMSMNAQNITNQERIRALDAQERAAGAVSQGGFQGYGLGLSTAQGERGLEQALAGMGLSADTTRGNMQLSDTAANQSGASLGLQQQGMLQDVNSGYRQDLLGYGSLAGQLGGNSTAQALQAAGLFPALNAEGRSPGDDAMAYAGYDRGLQEQLLGSQVDRFNYLRDQPYNNLGWYGSLLNGTVSPYGTSSSTGRNEQSTKGGDVLQAAAAIAMMFSDRRLKSRIEQIGATLAGIPIYRYQIFGRDEIGVMADEVAEIIPTAVHRHWSGFDMVDYAQVR
jgi:hypothetical protein